MYVMGNCFETRPEYKHRALDNVRQKIELCPTKAAAQRMNDCSNDCNQMLRGKRVREENRLPHIVN